MNTSSTFSEIILKSALLWKISSLRFAIACTLAADTIIASAIKIEPHASAIIFVFSFSWLARST